MEIDRRLTAFRPGAGALSRSPAWWDYLFLDREHGRQGGSALFHLVHPDGWAAYRIDRDEGRCRVVELVAATDEAHVALWRVLLGLDLVRTVSTEVCSLDDPLPFLLADHRRVRLRGGPDGACCDPTDRLPDAHAEIAALGSLYLGGHRAATLARAGLVQVTDPAVVSRVDAAFTAERSPQFGTAF